MKNIGTKNLETERLILKIPTMNEQKRLWEILLIPDVCKYYLDINKKFINNLYSWEKQESFYKLKVEHALDKDKYEWSIFLKDFKVVIGQINAHISDKENYGKHDESVMSVGWYIDPKYQGNGYATEAALAMVKYMFEEVEITEFRTSVCIKNEASWRLMEKIGFVRDKNKTIFNNYTFLDNPEESYLYSMTKEKYLNEKI